ncbi:MAG TPA: 3-hydroxybutyryl-CoA dehydrogenase [Dermatophilaceae bacterium]|nr:3-hydroxybutyryl-CoA dehydrogenase [Dermatophilaceae bacterium]
MARRITKVGVVGLGIMGGGIAEVMARYGHEVVGVEKDEAAVERARQLVEHSAARALAKGKVTEKERDALLSRITYTTRLEDCSDCLLVVEAVPEDFDLKREILTALDAVVPEDAVLATSTSALSVTEIAVTTTDPKRVIGFHFFNPPTVLQLVEVVRTVMTAEDVVEDVVAFAEDIGKHPIVVGDKAGFIANALLLGYLNHAVSMYENRYASREDIDAAMRFGCAYPMGPLALLDLIGLDDAYAILELMYREGRDRLHAPAPILKQMISAGLIGRKSGRGFYTYAAPGSPEVVQDLGTAAPAAAGGETRAISRVGVVGSGTMAGGIVEVFAKAGLDVVFVARGEDKLAGVVQRMGKNLGKMVDKGRMTREDADAALTRVSGSTSREDLADVDLVVEAIAEDLEVKQQLFRDLDRICKPGAVLATTTSSLPVVDCARATSRPQDVVGLHFFNPAPIMKLVEVVHTVSTAPDVVSTAQALCKRIGKHPVTCGDRSGFIVNALLFPYLNDAVRMLEAHYASADDIDTAIKLGCNLPMGPFELLDVVGLDVSLAIQRQLFTEFREPGFAPAPMLEHLVTAGYLGRKTRRGFRTYA